MVAFKWIENPVVAFFDNEDIMKTFMELRKTLPANRTKIIKLDRSKMWSFSLLGRIKSIFSRPQYPRYLPNTVYPEYSCAMHAKYDYMDEVARNNPFNTKYLSWVDLGYFRDLVNKNTTSFSLYTPPKFDESRVAYCEIGHFYPNLNIGRVVSTNLIWLAGGFFVSTVEVMRRWTRQYRQYTERMLENNWMSTDEQVLFSMYLQESEKLWNRSVDIQPYSGRRFDPWFYLGYLCRESGLNRSQTVHGSSLVNGSG